jgi:hypothetical protein
MMGDRILSIIFAPVMLAACGLLLLCDMFKNRWR